MNTILPLFITWLCFFFVNVYWHTRLFKWKNDLEKRERVLFLKTQGESL